MLGEKITAKIRAKYYFGSPVTNATVKYKVMRSEHTAHWYPPGPWDWLYGPGYWWFAYDYDWYPGWRDWGCRRPTPWWYLECNRTQPEIVAQREVPIGPDGTVDVEIDTSVAKALHPDEDERYSIEAEVVDQSRRTIVGNGDVLVARQPFQVSAWVDRGYYRVGDTIKANFAARRLDGKPVEGTGKLRLLKSPTVAGRPNASRDRNRSPLLDAGHERRGPRRYSTESLGKGPVPALVQSHRQGRPRNRRRLRVHDHRRRLRRQRLPLQQSGNRARQSANTRRMKKFSCRSTQTASTRRSCLFVRPSNGVYLPPQILHARRQEHGGGNRRHAKRHAELFRRGR